MSLPIDTSLLRALSLSNSSSISMSPHGGSGFASTFCLTTPSSSYFVKTSSAPGARAMFQGEHASLNAIHKVVPSMCPRAFAWGPLDSDSGYFLATEFLQLGGNNEVVSGRGSGESLATKLATLHSTPAPVPEEYDRPVFGFPVTTCCGDTEQDNAFEESWSSFFAVRRLLSILTKGEATQGRDAVLRCTVERVVMEVVPRLLGEGWLGGRSGVKPVVVHGDLWSGNKGVGRFVGREGDGGDTVEVEAVVFDPSTCYAHGEFDHGIMRMFGGFDSNFWKEYFLIVPKTVPADEYDDRVSLYESYHHLNHWAMFGGSYKGGAMRILKGLLQKYDSNT